MARRLTDAEKNEFRNAVADIKPLRKNSRVEPNKESRRKPPARNKVPRQPAPPAPVQTDRTKSEPLWFARTNAGAAGRSLETGQLDPDATLDLHGLYADAARRKLEDFLAASISNRRRCVRIITGKGLRSDAAGPILRPMCIDLLKTDPRVRAFCTPPLHAGGSGALDVLLID